MKMLSQGKAGFTFSAQLTCDLEMAACDNPGFIKAQAPPLAVSRVRPAWAQHPPAASPAQLEGSGRSHAPRSAASAARRLAVAPVARLRPSES